MSEVNSHAPGSFCWPELATTDPAGAKTFYTALFGWDVLDQPTPQGVYSMLKLGGRDVGALYQMGPQEQGVPSHWNTYVAVSSADDAAAKTRQLGGTVIAGPFDVFDFGRMAVLQDPAGAMFCVWEARSHHGVGRIDEPGTLCWSELQTTDTARAGQFYERLFGWRLKVGTEPPGMYTEFINGGRPIGGMMAIQAEWGPVPPNWMPYFAVGDADTIAARARELGGSLKVAPTDIPNVGRFSVIQDPQGAVFAVIQLTAGAA